jgi:hypothetical protein
LQQLGKQGLTIRRAEGGWSLTPLGREKAVSLMGEIKLTEIEPELLDVSGAYLEQGFHTLIPPEFAPLIWAASIQGLLQRFSFEKNVFCMTRFPDKGRNDLPDPVGQVVNRVEVALQSHGLTLHLASDRSADDDLFGNVAAHMWACKYGIGLFEDRAGEGLNYNLVIEVGSMLMTGRRCALLKDVTISHLPTDLVGRIYKAVDFDDPASVTDAVHRWVVEDLGMAPCSACTGSSGRGPLPKETGK